MAKGSSTPITAVILTVAVAIVVAISYQSYQSKKPSRDDDEEDKNDNVVRDKESDKHNDDIPEERKDRSTSDATPLTSNVHKDGDHNVSVEGKEVVVVDSLSSPTNEEYVNDTNPTTPKQKKKKKKIRPKLTPTSPSTPTENTDNSAEDDLGFGDIATSSNSPKLLKKTIKLRTQGTNANNNNTPPNVEEGANYNSLSSYWKNQDKEHKFVAPVDSSASLPTSSLSKRINTSSGSASSLVDDTKKKKGVCSSGSGDLDTKQAEEEPEKKDDEVVKEVEEEVKIDKDEVVPKALDLTETKDSVMEEGKIESIEATGEDEGPPTTSSLTQLSNDMVKEDVIKSETNSTTLTVPKEEEVTKGTVIEDIVVDGNVDEGNKEMAVSKPHEEVPAVEQEAVKEVEDKVIDTPNSTNEDEQQLIIPSPTTSEDESSSSNQQLIVPSATTSENESSSDKDDDVDMGGGGGSSSSQEFVNIYKSPSNDVLTESEFLSRDVTTATTEGGTDMSGKGEGFAKKEIDVTVPQFDEAGSTDTADVQSTSPNKEDISEKEKEIEVAAEDTNKEVSVESSANQDMKKNNNRKRNNNKKKKKGKGKKRR